MRYLSLWMVFRDPPEHTRLRRLVGTAFMPRSIEALAEPVGRVVDQLLDALPRDQPVDWAQQVAMPLPAYVILDLLGIPHQSYADLKAWSDDLRAFVGSSRADPDRYNRARHGATQLAGFFREVIAARRAAPGEDFVSRMITARDEQGSLSEDELVATCMLVLFAGHETTTHLLSNSANALLDHPDQLQRLRDKMRAWDKAVAPAHGKPMIAYHNTWAYFARRFRLNFAATIEPRAGVPPTPSHLAALQNIIKKQDVTAIVRQPNEPQKHVQFLAGKSGAKVLVLADSVGAVSEAGDYLSLFDYNIGVLAQAFK
jgi:cytochrome P450